MLLAQLGLHCFCIIRIFVSEIGQLLALGLHGFLLPIRLRLLKYVGKPITDARPPDGAVKIE